MKFRSSALNRKAGQTTRGPDVPIVHGSCLSVEDTSNDPEWLVVISAKDVRCNETSVELVSRLSLPESSDVFLLRANKHFSEDEVLWEWLSPRDSIWIELNS